MSKLDIVEIKEKLAILKGKPLRSFKGLATFGYITFGDQVEVKGASLRDENGQQIRDENGKTIHETEVEGEYWLYTDSAFRFTIGHNIITANADIDLPTQLIASDPNFSFDTFNNRIDGNRRLEEQIERHFFDNDFSDYIVKDITVNKFGDFTIYFENDFIIESFCNSFTAFEDWVFSKHNSEDGNWGISVVRGKIRN